MEIKELQSVAEMLEQIDMIRFLYPKITFEKYQTYLSEMVTRNYTQVAVFDNQKCVGVTGCWFGIKLWSGKYMEIDNFVIHPDYRGKGIGKLLTDFIHQKAQSLDCSMVVLDAFTVNFDAHRLYYKQGFEPRGFHFIKTLDKSKLT